MEHIYLLPDRDKADEAHTRVSNEVIIKMLSLNTEGRTGKALQEYVTEQWWKHRDSLTDEEDDAFEAQFEAKQLEDGARVPYFEGYAERWADTVQKHPLHDVELYIHVIADYDRMLSEPRDVRYLWQCLQERVNQLILTNQAEDVAIKIPRLNLAIEWLKGYEQRLVSSETQRLHNIPAFAWHGSKADLAELGYALLESGSIQASNRGVAVKRIGEMFGVALGDNPAVHLQTIQKRKAGSILTPLLNKLQQAFTNYLMRKDEDVIEQRKKKP